MYTISSVYTMSGMYTKSICLHTYYTYHTMSTDAHKRSSRNFFLWRCWKKQRWGTKLITNVPKWVNVWMCSIVGKEKFEVVISWLFSVYRSLVVFFSLSRACNYYPTWLSVSRSVDWSLICHSLFNRRQWAFLQHCSALLLLEYLLSLSSLPLSIRARRHCLYSCPTMRDATVTTPAHPYARDWNASAF